MHITGIYYYPSQTNWTQRQYLQVTFIQGVLNTSTMVCYVILSPKCHIVNDLNSYFILIINKI